MQQKQKSDFGDFEEVKTEDKKQEQPKQPQIPSRVRMPRSNELIGIIIRRLGGNKMEIKATDGKTRNCRVPGRYKRRLWLRPKDIILIVPWDLDNAKADIIYKYNSSEVNQLKRRGIISQLQEEF
jgi:translation initiation factor 1A